MIDDKDIRVDPLKVDGGDGYTLYGIKVSHLPTGTSATCGKFRAQMVNKAEALLCLKVRLVAGAECLRWLKGREA